jgi:hypothetical protein
MNPFEKHYHEDLEPIELQGITFHVKLPNLGNKRFQRAVLAQIVEQNDAGEFVTKDTKLDEMVDANVNALVRTCIRNVDGWNDFTVDKLLALPDACEDLWDIVVKVNAEKEAEADDTIKKPLPISSGQENGQEKQTSTKGLQKAAG